MILPVQMVASQNAIRTTIKNQDKEERKMRKNIMSLATGTRLRCKVNGYVYVLGDFVSDTSRRLISDNGFVADYINYDNQSEYEVVE